MSAQSSNNHQADNLSELIFPVDSRFGQQIIEASPSGIVLVDARLPDLPVIYVNTAFEQLTGYSRDEALGRNPRFLHAMDTGQPGLATLREAIASETSCTVILRNYRKDGSIFWNELRISPIQDTDGVTTHFIGIQNDISERKHAEDHLRFLNRTALELLRLPDQNSIYTYIGNELKNLLQDVIVLVNDVLPHNRHMRIQGVYGLDETQLGRVIRYMGYSPVGRVYPDDPVITPLFKKGHLVEVEGGLPYLAERVLPRFLTRQLARLFNLNHIYLIGLQQDDDFYAGIQLYMRGDAIVEQPDLVEAFVQQASIALQRVQAVNAHEKARTRLHKNEQQLNAFFAQSLDGFFFMMLDEPVRWDDTTDKEATLDYVFTHLQVTRINDAMLNQYGATEADFIGYTPVDFFQHDMQHGRDVFRQFYDAGKIHIKTDERRLDGSPLIVEGYYVCLYDENGRITGHFGVQRDITDQEKMKRDLLASEARANAMLDAVPDMVFRINKAGMYLDYRGAEADLYTRSRQEVIGKHFDEVPLPAPVREKVWQCIQQAFDTGEIQTCEYDLAVPGAPEETFEARIVRSGDDEVMAFVRNISDRKQAEQRELQAALNNERLHLLTDFIQNAAHEFRTPLSIMRTSTYLLERQLSPNKQNKYVTRLDRQVNRVTRLVDMLLMMVRITNQDDWLSVSVRIDELIEQVCDDALAHTNTQVTIDRTQAQQPLLVPGHADWLKKALRQPVDNALRFTPPDGVITLATHSDDTHVIVNIHNTGSIIPEAALPHIFDVFWRDDNAHSTPGFGLGLPITQRIIEAHNGTITVHSDPTTGTTFSITLPVIQKARTM